MSNDARLLDSSVVIRHFRQGGAVTAKLGSFSSLYLPSIALGELHGGANRSARPAKNFALVEAFLPSVIVVPVDEATALYYGRVNAQLAAEGALIPQNDMWIAACAMQWSLTVATTDAHYGRIAGLNVEMW